MPIREGVTTNKFLSADTFLQYYITGDIDGKPMRRKGKKKVAFSAATQNKNNFEIKTDFNGQPVTITYEKFIQGAEEGLIASDDGDLYLKLVEAGGGERHDHFLKEGEVANIHKIRNKEL